MGSELMKIQVMMVGGRRCGKTSVLAAMQSCFENVCEDADLMLFQSNSDTRAALGEKHMELQEYFSDPESEFRFIPDANPNEERKVYSFAFAVGKREKIPVDFLDYPGEWLIPNRKMYREQISAIEEDMKKSQVLVIAIDTPHMMEEEGRFNDRRNLCSSISQTLADVLESAANKEKRLVLFVPLKCERYLEKKQMPEVLQKVKEKYKKLITFFGRHPEQYEVAVTPIYTMGNAMFAQFGWDDEKNDIKIDPEYKTPSEPYYILINDKKYAPKNCEQPLLYLLSYLMQLAKDKKSDNYSNAGFWERLFINIGIWFGGDPNSDTYRKMKDTISKKLARTKPGYEILQDPLKL